MPEVGLCLPTEMFKFNFNVDSEDNSSQEDHNQAISVIEPAQEVVPNCKITDFISSCTNYENCKCGSVLIKHIPPKAVVNYLHENSITSSVLTAEGSHSDLLSGVYEGGLKVWECTFDLLNYLENNNISFNGLKVLDLGCGAGLLGIYALLKGASFVVLQDFNKEVLEFTTIPNVLLNDCGTERIKCFSGDWSSFLNVCNKQFDYVLTSETIYNTNSYKKLIEVFKKCCKSSGVIYVAAKSYYFGVGGGIKEFQSEVEKNNFHVSTVWKCDEGINREILKIKCSN